MALGPSICKQCQVFPDWVEMGDGPGGIWKCPICGDTELNDYAPIGSDLTKYKENLKFLKFVKGIE